MEGGKAEEAGWVAVVVVVVVVVVGADFLVGDRP